jgi:signal transduction histidine kinase
MRLFYFYGKLFSSLLLCLLGLQMYAQDTIQLTGSQKIENIGLHTYMYADEHGTLNYYDILDPHRQDQFYKSETLYPNFGSTKSVVWCKLLLKNTSKEKYLLEIGEPTLDSINFYQEGNNALSIQTGNNYAFNDRSILTNLFLLPLDLDSGEVKTFYLRLKSDEPLQFTIKTGTYKAFLENNQSMDVIQGMYYGFMLVIVLYNVFLFLGIRDTIYLYYVFFTASICFSASYIKGYEVVLFKESLHWLNPYPAIIYSIASVSAIIFSMRFLQIGIQAPVWNKGFWVLLPLHFIPILLNIFGNGYEAMILLQSVIFLSSIYLYTVVIIIFKKGYQPAKYFLWGWSAFLSGVLVTLMKDNQLLPSNDFTNNAFQIGSSLEVLLLSMALADKINNYRKEKRIAAALVLRASRENAKIMLQQKTMLETKVKERTFELEDKNEVLNKQKEELKELNTMKDKIFSILSHDIRGPLNSLHGIIGLLKSKGLSKEDMDMLLEDLSRTLSTTRNLLDNILHWAISHIKEGKSSMVTIDLKETVNETIEILRYSARTKNITVENRIYKNVLVTNDVNMVRLVLRNLLSNAIKFTPENGVIYIEVQKKENELVLSVVDTGMGISDDNLKKLFSIKDNYSTKGTSNEKGTGIGLILCKEFLNKNNENIWAESTEGKGSIFKFTITDHQTEHILI